MGKCFIVDVRIGIWATGDQMLFTLSHSPQVQWPSKCVCMCVFVYVFPRRCSGSLAQLLSPAVTRQLTQRGLICPRKWNSLLLFIVHAAQIGSINLWILVGEAYQHWPADLVQDSQTVRSTVHILLFRLSICNPVTLRRSFLWILFRSDKEVSAENVTSEQICIKLGAVSPCPLLDWLMWGGGGGNAIFPFLPSWH